MTENETEHLGKETKLEVLYLVFPCPFPDTYIKLSNSQNFRSTHNPATVLKGLITRQL